MDPALYDLIKQPKVNERCSGGLKWTDAEHEKMLDTLVKHGKDYDMLEAGL